MRDLTTVIKCIILRYRFENDVSVKIYNRWCWWILQNQAHRPLSVVMILLHVWFFFTVWGIVVKRWFPSYTFQWLPPAVTVRPHFSANLVSFLVTQSFGYFRGLRRLLLNECGPVSKSSPASGRFLSSDNENSDCTSKKKCK